jgi:NAD(P)-dependent dehydrogenase (short-subunit alcohol dehydrogenase family)
MDSGLRDKVVLITGAGSGIGRSTALAFADEGCKLALLDLNRSSLESLSSDLKPKGVKVSLAGADLSSETGVNSGIDQVLNSFGGEVDVLVNNVGAGSVRRFDEITDEAWRETFDLNFLSAVRASRKVLPVMRKNGSGVIVNNASDLGRQPEPNPIDYGCLKAALLALTKGLARAEGPAIRINAVAPGPIWTPFWTKPGGFAETLGKLHSLPPMEAVEHEMKLRQLPLARLGRPEEVANVIVFLASDLASFVTSSVWGVDGGSVRSIT